MNIVVTTAPTEAEILALLSVPELKKNMRTTHSAEDDIFKWCILAAYDWLANPRYGWLNRSILTTQFTMYLSGWVRDKTIYDRQAGAPATIQVATTQIILPRPPLQSVQSIIYQSGGVPQTLDPSQYRVAASGLFGTISQAASITWPTGLDVGEESVAISYTAGFGNATKVRAEYAGLVQAMKLLAGDAYRNREDTYSEPRLVAVNRKVINGVARFAGRYRIENHHA